MKQYSSMVRPLTELTRKSVDCKWATACDEAFHALKQALIGCDIMAYPKETDLYILDTDASDYQVAEILSQIQDGRKRVISYGSRILGKPEKIIALLTKNCWPFVTLLNTTDNICCEENLLLEAIIKRLLALPIKGAKRQNRLLD